MAEEFSKIVKGIKIDPAIFTFPFSCKCNGECCHYGVYTDLKEHDLILEIKEKLFPHMDESQTTDTAKWFEAPEEDEDFESGVAVGTDLYNGKCAFLDKNGLCSLQKLAIAEGEHKWKYKPIYCVLFPLTVYEGALTIDDDHINRLNHCNKNPEQNISIFDACKEEIIHFLGEDGYAEAEQYRDEYLKSIKSKDVA